MAGQITGKFIGDFTSFNNAVDKAIVHLKGMETGASKVQTGLDKMVQQFSGQKVVQEAQLMAKAFELLAEKGIGLTTKELQRMGAAADEAIAKLRAGGEQIPPGIKKISDAAAESRKRLEEQNKAAEGGALSFGKLFSSFTAANLATSAIQKLGATVSEVIDRSQKLPGIEASFQKLSTGIGQESNKMIATLQGATKGLVGEMELMQTANKAMLLGLPVTVESMGEMADAATKLGRAMGKDATSSIDDMITALGRSSPMILDNLGLTVKVGEANEAYARKLGTTAEALTDNQQKMAFYEAAMEAARKKSKELGDQSLTLGEILKSIWVVALDHATRYAAFINREGGKLLSAPSGGPSGAGGGIAEQAAENRFRIVAEQMDAMVRSGGNVVKMWGDVNNQVTVTGKSFDAIGRPIKDATGALNLHVMKADELDAVYNELSRTYNRTGKEISDATQAATKAAQAEREAIALLAEVTVAEYAAIVKTIQDYEKNVVAASRTTTVKLSEMGTAYKNFGKDTAEIIRVLGINKRDPEAVMLPNIPYIDFEGIQRGLAKVTKGSDTFDKSLDEISKSLTQLATVGGDSFGQIASGLATLIVSAKTVKSSIGDIGAGFKAGGVEGFLGMASGVVGIASAAITAGTAIWKALSAPTAYEKRVRESAKAISDLKDAAIKTAGGVQNLRAEWSLLNMGMSFDEFFKIKDAKAFEGLMDQFEKKLPEIPKHLNEMVRNAALAGEQIPAAMAPIIESLIRQGELTQENANLLMGLPEKGVPAFKEVEDAAERLGLNIDSIGQSIKQMGFTDAASKVAADLDILQRAGADMHAVLEGSRDKIQKLVDDAQKYGYSLPASIKPFLEQMAKSGQLTDAFGEKLGDLEDLHFTKPLEESVDDLIEAMKELVKVIKDDVGGALDDLGNKVVTPKINLPSGAAIQAGGGAVMNGDVVVRSNLYIDGYVAAESVSRQVVG